MIASRSAAAISENEIRMKSANLVSPADIQELDEALIRLVTTERSRTSVVIDSHPVTKEAYGFRVTGFSEEQLQRLSPDVIVCLYASSNVIVSRIQANPMGRPLPTPFEVDMHTLVQAQVAVQYGIMLGKPVYLFDSSVPEAELAISVARKTRI
jgi:adenylate kinase